MKTIQELINDVVANPMFHFSLGSKELFHSNFWFWLSTINQKETLKLFSETICDGNVQFKRETSIGKGVVIDLCIDCENGKRILIENKIKDYPYQAQLKKEKEYSKDGTDELVLITLIPYEEDLLGFTQITYKELANRISPESFSSDSLIQSYITNYKDLISCLSDIIPNHEDDDTYDFARSYNQYTFLDEIKFAEVYQKYRASHFCNKIIDYFELNQDDKYENTFHKDGCVYIVDKALFHGHGVINIHKKIKSHPTKDANIWAGVQIENTQFRVMFHGDYVKSYDKDKLLALCNKVWKECGIIDKQGRGNDGYCKYGSDCIYKYKTISEMMPYNELIKKIESVLKAIDKNISEL